MPELPEVETVRRDIDAAFGGRLAERVEAPGVVRLRRHSQPEELVRRVEGRRLVGVGRHGKYLLLRLDSADVVAVHLGMSGQLRREEPGASRAPHTHVVVSWGDAGELRLIDPRTFGELFVSRALPGGRPPELGHLGSDALDPELSARRFGDLVLARRARLKALLMDQRFVAGIGNLYADEILWAARLRADRSSAGLSAGETRRLFQAMRTTLAAAVEHRGSSLADAQYRDLSGRVGGHQAYHRAYGREGMACRRCRRPIVRVKAGGRSSFSCPRCQR